MSHNLGLTRFFALLTATFLFALSQNAYSQEDDSDEYIEPNQAQIDSLLNLIKPDSPDSVKANLYYEIADICLNYNLMLKYALLSYEHCSETDYLLKAYNCKIIGLAYYMFDESDKAIAYHFEAAKLFNQLSMPADEALIYNGIGNCYEDLNITDSIFFYYNKALKIFMDIKDTADISYTYCLMGRIYYDMDLLDNAEKNYLKALHYATLVGDTLEMATCYYFLYSSKPDTAGVNSINYLKKSVSLFESKNIDINYYSNVKYDAYSSLAHAYINAAKSTGKNEYADSCHMCINKIGNYYLIQGQYSNYVNDRYNYVEYLTFYKRHNEALAELIRLSKYMKEETSTTNLKDYHSRLYEAYLHLGNYKKALEHFEKYDEYRFANLNDNTFNSLKNAEVQRTKMIEELKLENAEKLHAAEKLRMRIVNTSLIGGLFLVSLLAVFIFRILRIKHKANAELSEKNALLAEQKEEISSQRDTIKAQSDNIQASINYARRIQRSLLTPSESIDLIFPEHFLLYNPRDIVSGDYYWVGQFGDNKVCIVADCTGHGVPGGFLSVLGMSNLNYIVSQDVSPDTILNRLRDAIIANLRQTANSPTALHDNDVSTSPTEFDRSCDGMDAAVYVINEKLMKLSFSGANNPLVLIRGNKIQVLKGDRMPVGIYARITPFTSTTIDLQKGDCIYTFSDGFQDQFGNGTHDKFSSQRLRELLLEIHQLPMNEQKDILNRTYEEWRGPASNQTDDIVIMGVRI